MTIKEEYKHLLYIPYINEILNFRHIATGTDNKKVMTSVIKKENIQIAIPINSKGEFDFIQQQEIAEKYLKIELIKKNISDELERVYRADVDFE